MRTVVLRVVALALLLLLALFSALSIRTLRRLPDTVLYFVQAENNRFSLAPAGRDSRADNETDRLIAALNALVVGPNEVERAAGLSSAFPAETQVLDLSLENSTVTVNLSPGFETKGDLASEQGRLYQLYYTLTQSKNVDKVYLNISGDPARVFGSEGLRLTRPWERPAADLPEW